MTWWYWRDGDYRWERNPKEQPMKPHDESVGTTLERASATFGPVPASGLFAELVKRFGPVLAQLVLNWLLSAAASRAPVPAGASADFGTLVGWAVALLEAHEAEIVALLKSQVERLVKEAIAALKSSGGGGPATDPFAGQAPPAA